MLAHATVGRGEAVVIMLHGLLGRGAQLWPLARRLVEKRPELRIALPDLRGHGRSPPLAEEPALDQLAADVVALADHLGAATFSLVGHSMGGRVALAAALLAPQRIASAVVLDVSPADLSSRPSPIAGMIDALLAAPERTPDRAAMREALVRAGASEEEADALLIHVDANGDAAWRIDRRALARLRMQAMPLDLWAAVPRLSRVGLIYGTRSPFVLPEDARAYERLGATVVEIPDAGHLLHLEAPEMVADAVSKLL